MHIVINESNPRGIQGILEAQTMGHDVTFITADKSFYIRECSLAYNAFSLERVKVIEDRGVFEPSYLWEIVQKLHQEKKIDGITTFSEWHTEQTAIVARNLHLLGMDVEGAKNSRNKFLTRKIVQEAGIYQPKFQLVCSKEELEQAIHKTGIPAMLKPTDGTAGLGIRKVQSLQETFQYFDDLPKSPTNYGREITKNQSSFLVEEYIEGELFSVESCVIDGKVQNFGITDRKRILATGHTGPIEMGGTFMWDHPQREILFALNERVLRALKVNFGFNHTEYLITQEKPLLLENNARLAGGIIPSMMLAATGVNTYYEVIRQALGEKPVLPYAKNKVCTGRHFGSPTEGIFEDVKMQGLEEIPGFVEKECYAKKGERITPLTGSNFDWLGHVLYTGKTRQESVANAEKALASISMYIKTPVIF